MNIFFSKLLLKTQSTKKKPSTGSKTEFHKFNIFLLSRLTTCIKILIRTTDGRTHDEQEIAQSSKLTMSTLCQDEIMKKSIKVVQVV